MTVLAKMPFDVHVNGILGSRQPWDVHVNGPETEEQLFYDVLVDGTLKTVALGETEQLLAFRVLIDDVVVDHRWFTGQWTVTQNFEGVSAQLSVLNRLDLGYHDTNYERHPFVEPLRAYSPLFGKSKISIDGGYVTSSGVTWIRLLTDGIVDSGVKENGIHTVVIADKSARIDRQVITTRLAPGHNTSRDSIIKQRFELVGESDFSLEPMRKMNKEIQSIEAPVLPLSRELADIEGRALFYDKEGSVVNPRTIPSADDPTEWLFKETNIVSSSVNSISDIPTRVCLTGTLQIVRDCGIRVEVKTTEIFEDYKPLAATKKQGSAGAITSIIQASSLAKRIVSRVETTLEWDCDVLLSERTKVWAWFNPQIARYRQDETAILSYKQGVYFYDSAVVKDDTVNAYLWPIERFEIISDTLTTNLYDLRLFNTEIITNKSQWYIRRSARFATGSNFTTDTFGDGTGVSTLSGLAETFQLVETISHKKDIDDNGFETGSKDTVTGYFSPPGSAFTYFNGKTSSAGTENFLLKSTVRISLQASSGESTHRKVITESDSNGTVIRIITSNESGFLPAAEKAINDAASRFEVQQIESDCSAPSLETYHEKYVLNGSSQYAEDVEELDSICFDMLARGAALQGSIEIPVHFLLKAPAKIHVIDSGMELNHDCFVTQVTHTNASENSPTLTAVNFDIFPPAFEITKEVI